MFSIVESKYPIFLARRYSSSVSGLEASSLSISVRFFSLAINHGSILVIILMADISTPLFSASYTTNILSSSQSCSLSHTCASVQLAYFLSVRLSLDISAPRTAFIIACSKVVPIAITSPVAFICVPSLRFA